MSSRHRSREVALQALYALDVARLRLDDKAPTAQEVYERVADHFEAPEGGRAFAKELVISVSENLSSLDALIAEHARNWRVTRMATVDRNVLRLAAFELTQTQTPIGVILDEAVELARRFGSDASPAFVNGILDAVAHAVRDNGS